MVKGKPYGLMNHIPDGMMTRGQAAQEIGKSKDTLRRWHESGRFVTANSVTIGTRKVWLYSAEDIAKLKELSRTVRPGRKAHGNTGSVREGLR